MKMNDNEYFALGSIEDIYISSSSLKHINPEEGGCPQAFHDFVTNNMEQKESLSLERGSLIHKFAESPEEFLVSDVEEPSAMGVKWCIAVKNYIDKEELDRFDSRNVDDVAVKMKNELGIYNNVSKTDKIIEKFAKECIPYLNFLYDSDGKIAMTPATRLVVDNATRSLYDNPAIHRVLFDCKEGQEEVKEGVAIWEKEGLKFKAKLDHIKIDHNEKIIHIGDIKTTSDAVSLFKWSFTKYKIYRQMAFYANAAHVVFDDLIKQGYKLQITLYVVETKGYFNSAPFIVPLEWLNKGQEEIKKLLARVKFHKESNNWNLSMEQQVNNGFMELPRTEEIYR